MKMRRSIVFRTMLLVSLFFFLSFSGEAFAGTFDGYKVLVNAPTAGGYPISIEYQGGDIYVPNAGAGTLTACSGGGTVSPGTNYWTVTRSTTTGYWCFQGNNSSYTIYYNNNYPPTTPGYKWLPNDNKTGFYNAKDFDATGDGATDDTAAVRNAVIYIASKLGGTLYFPLGDYKITSTINLPPGILLQGAMGRLSETGTYQTISKSPSRILLATANTAAFRIGENNENVRFLNIEITATTDNGTIGVEGVGKFHDGLGPTQFISFDNVVFRRLDKGIYVHDADNTGNWQFDFVKVEHCYFVYNKTAGIYLNIYNSDWNISSSFFQLPGANDPNAPKAGDGIYIRRAGAINIANTFGGGIGGDSGGYYYQGGDFIDANEVTNLTITNSEAERLNNSIVIGNVAQSGNKHNSLTIIGSIFGAPILLKEKIRFVSTGNLYAGATVNSSHTGVQIYSTGDRFCYDNSTVPTNPCENLSTGQTAGFQGTGQVVFQTGQPQDVYIPAINAVMGTDTDFKGRINLSVLTLTQLGALASPSAGAVVYCSNCNANTAPCTAGGSGALAVHNGSQWTCK